MKRFTKQTKKELKSLAEVCRRWQPMYVTEVAKLFIHIKAQELEIETLERHLSELRQANFFKKQLQLENAPPIAPPCKATEERWPLPKRLRFYKETADTKGWDLALKLNGITEQEALDMING